jgi:hypothetical protein
MAIADQRPSMTHAKILAHTLRQLWNTGTEPDAHTLAIAMGATCAHGRETNTYTFTDGSIADVDFIDGCAVGIGLNHPTEVAKIRNDFWLEAPHRD